MFELSIFLRERLIGRSTFSLEEVRIGRSADNEVRIDNPALSRYHASIESVAGIHLLKDFGSQNGTLVNGERVSGRRGLTDGDRIQVGKFTLVFRTDKRAAVSHAEVRDHASYAVAGETMIVRTIPIERECPWVGYLEAAGDGFVAGPRHPITRDFFLIGTSSQAQLVLDRNTGAADRAALVVRTWQGFALVPLAPGVLKNKEPVDLSAPLQAGDKLQLGQASFEFHAGRPDA
jgi:hypothetical protein